MRWAVRYVGTVAFVGPVHYAKGIFVGVITDDPTSGKNDGMHIELFKYKHHSLSKLNRKYQRSKLLQL